MPKTPRYTDGIRYPNGYTKSTATDISRTFKRVRAQIKEKAEQDERDAAEAREKTVALRRRVAP